MKKSLASLLSESNKGNWSQKVDRFERNRHLRPDDFDYFLRMANQRRMPDEEGDRVYRILLKHPQTPTKILVSMASDGWDVTGHPNIAKRILSNPEEFKGHFVSERNLSPKSFALLGDVLGISKSKYIASKLEDDNAFARTMQALYTDGNITDLLDEDPSVFSRQTLYGKTSQAVTDLLKRAHKEFGHSVAREAGIAKYLKNPYAESLADPDGYFEAEAKKGFSPRVLGDHVGHDLGVAGLEKAVDNIQNLGIDLPEWLSSDPKQVDKVVHRLDSEASKFDDLFVPHLSTEYLMNNTRPHLAFKRAIPRHKHMLDILAQRAKKDPEAKSKYEEILHNISKHVFGTLGTELADDPVHGEVYNKVKADKRDSIVNPFYR